MLSLTILLFIILDPFGNICPVNALLKHVSPADRTRIIAKECLIATFILIAAALLGQKLLGLLSLKEYSLSVAGGVILFLVALGMIFPSLSPMSDTVDEKPFIVPIAVPLIAGPGTISLIMLLSKKYPTTDVIGAILLACLLTTAILTCSPAIYQRLGNNGSKVLERLMGMLLIIISVQMIIDGLRQCF